MELVVVDSTLLLLSLASSSLAFGFKKRRKRKRKRKVTYSLIYSPGKHTQPLLDNK